MNKELVFYINELENDIKNAYEGNITITEAEKLAAKFLKAQMVIARELESSDLDTKMRKSGLKSIRAAVYMDEAKKDAKKPSDTLLEHHINMNEIVLGEQNRFDEAESSRDLLQNYLNIFRDGHLYFRMLAKGTFSG